MLACDVDTIIFTLSPFINANINFIFFVLRYVSLVSFEIHDILLLSLKCNKDILIAVLNNAAMQIPAQQSLGC
jgi:hypothetical protein